MNKRLLYGFPEELHNRATCRTSGTSAHLTRKPAMTNGDLFNFSTTLLPGVQGVLCDVIALDDVFTPYEYDDLIA